MEADPATMSRGMRRADLLPRTEETPGTTNLLGNVSQMPGWALLPARNTLPLIQVLGLHSVFHRPWTWRLVGLADELGRAGSTGPVEPPYIGPALSCTFTVRTLQKIFSGLFFKGDRACQAFPWLATNTE